MNSLPFFNQRKVGLGVPLDGHLNFTVLAAGTACSFFSIFSGDVQYGATAVQEKPRGADEGSRSGQVQTPGPKQAHTHLIYLLNTSGRLAGQESGTMAHRPSEPLSSQAGRPFP